MSKPVIRMAAKQIVVLTKYENLWEQVTRRCTRYKFTNLFASNGKNPLDDAKVREELSQTEVMFCDLDCLAPYTECFPSLKWVQATFAGVDAILPQVKERGEKPPFLVTRLGGVFGQHMAEYVVGHIVSWERSFNKLRNYQKAHVWGNDCRDYRLFTNLTLGVLGVGDIGKTVAEYCKSLGMTVYGLKSGNTLPDKTEPFLDKWFARDDLPSMLNRSDYICNVLPATTFTDGILSNGILRHCADRKSVFINVGRGNIIRDQEIVEALNNGWIRGAILDVFEKEPLPASSPLWDMENIVITPHCSAVTFAGECVTMFLDNLERYEKGEDIKYIVDWTREY